jgi:hypothetical protein
MSDWMPGRRADQVVMCRNWIGIMTTDVNQSALPGGLVHRSFGLPDARSDYGVQIYYGLSGPPRKAFRFLVAKAPKSSKDLPYSVFTGRKKKRFDFDEESGNTVYFCLRYENAKGDKEGEGPFGPILSAVIP